MISSPVFCFWPIALSRMRSTVGSSSRRLDRRATDYPERWRLMGGGGSRRNCGSLRGGGRFEFHEGGIRRTSFAKPATILAWRRF
jgi:hypothetical protein